MYKKLFLLGMASSLVAIANPIDFFTDASFTYWYAKEDGLNVAETALLDRVGVAFLPSQAQVFKQSFGYKPGFKVGLGMASKDNWSLGAEYTYYRSTNTASKSAPELLDGIYTGVWSADNWFLQTVPTPRGQNLLGTHISSTWHLGMDLGDLTVKRPFNHTKTLELSPFAGLRTVWLRQKMNVSLTEAASAIGSLTVLPPQPLQSLNSSHAWGIGPRFGSQMHCNLPMGFRFEGLVAGTLLYEKFTSVKHSEGRAATFVTLSSFQINMDYNCIRPVAETSLGFGWGKTIYQKYNIDFAATYDFSYFWGQNMMRTMLDEAVSGVASGDNDLYFQGLTITAGFKF